MPIIATRASAAYGAGFAAVTTVPYQGPFGAYDSLATITVGATSVSSIEFLAIPTGYKHLQVRHISRSTSGTGRMRMQMNGNTGSNYSTHLLNGDGATPASFSGASQIQISAGSITTGDVDFYSGGIIDVLDYANTSKNKTVRIIAGTGYNSASGEVTFTSGSLLSTSAITSIKLYIDALNIAQYSQFALYGVK